VDAFRFRNFSAAKMWALMDLWLADLSFLAKFAGSLRRSENKTTNCFAKTADCDPVPSGSFLADMQSLESIG
jgi:hypothetical protein